MFRLRDSGHTVQNAITFTPTEEYDGTLVRCIASNPLWPTSKNATYPLNVLYPPRPIVDAPINIVVAESDSFRENMTVKGNPPVSAWRWRKNGVPFDHAIGNVLAVYQLCGAIVNSGGFAETSPPYVSRSYGMATPMGAQVPIVSSSPVESFWSQSTLYSPHQRYSSSSELRDIDNSSRSTTDDEDTEGIGGVRRRVKSTTSMPSSCEGWGLHWNNDVGAFGRERPARNVKKTPGTESPEEWSRTESSRRDQKKFSAAAPTKDPRSSAPQRSLCTESIPIPFPLIYVAPSGTISVILEHNVIIEMSVDRCIRVICFDKFAAFVNGDGTASCILHRRARILHTRDMIYTKFSASNDRLAIMGNEWILFSMSHLNEAYLLSSHIKGESVVSLETLDSFSGHLENDFSIRMFYHEAQTGAQYETVCKEIVSEATYDRKPNGTVVVHINGVTVRQTRNGYTRVTCRPRVVHCSPSLGSVYVHSSHIEMGVEAENEKAYVKRCPRRVHVSRSGMLVCNGNWVTSMDNLGRIVSSS